MSLIHFISAKAEQPFGTVQMRCLQPMELLSKHGWETAFFHFTKVDLSRTPDVVVFHRLPLNRVTDALLAYYRSRDVHVIYDTDDLIFGPEAGIFQGRFERMMAKVDEVSVSTPYLKKEAESLGWKTSLIPNFLSTEFLSKAEQLRNEARDPLHLIYASGSHTHDRDLDSIAEQLMRFLDAFPEARLSIVGKVETPEVLRSRAQVTVLDFIPYEQYPMVLAKASILLVPLDLEDPFNRARSEIKYLEANACGLRTIFSPIPVMKDWSEWDQELILCEQDQWYAVLDQLARAKKATPSSEPVLQRRSPQQAISWWNDLLAPVKKAKEAKWNTQRLSYSLFAKSRQARLGMRNRK